MVTTVEHETHEGLEPWQADHGDDHRGDDREPERAAERALNLGDAIVLESPACGRRHRRSR